MDKPNKPRSRKREILMMVAVLIAGLLGGNVFNIMIRPSIQELLTESTFSIELADEQLPAEIETADGTIEIMEVATVNSIDGNQLVDECPENEPECGKGHYVYAPVESPTAFKDYTLGGCWNIDDAYGAQCYDLAALFWMNYTNDGRPLSTCGTGAAKGSWDCRDYNAGSEFDLIYDPSTLQAGDWLIFGSGRYGHVGMALGNPNNGYIALLGQNQGGAACDGGGSAANIINISLNSFIGAFRPKTYIKPEPEPEPIIPISNCIQWHVLAGDTMGKIMLECENTIVYGEAMDAYAKTWYSLVVKPGQSVYDGWNSVEGVGLFENDDIEHRF